MIKKLITLVGIGMCIVITYGLNTGVPPIVQPTQSTSSSETFSTAVLVWVNGTETETGVPPSGFIMQYQLVTQTTTTKYFALYALIYTNQSRILSACINQYVCVLANIPKVNQTVNWFGSLDPKNMTSPEWTLQPSLFLSCYGNAYDCQLVNITSGWK